MVTHSTKFAPTETKLRPFLRQNVMETDLKSPRFVHFWAYFMTNYDTADVCIGPPSDVYITPRHIVYISSKRYV